MGLIRSADVTECFNPLTLGGLAPYARGRHEGGIPPQDHVTVCDNVLTLQTVTC